MRLDESRGGGELGDVLKCGKKSYSTLTAILSFHIKLC